VFEIIAVKVMELGFTIGTVDSDQESAFRGKQFHQFCLMNHITMHFIPVADHHGTAFVERFNRTLRILLEKLKVSQATHAWLQFLPQLMLNYNNRVHRTLGMSPEEALRKGVVTKDDTRYIHRRYAKAGGQPLNVQYLKIGDKVRVMIRKKQLVDKGSAPRFSVTRHMIESEIPGGLYTVHGRTEPYRANELLKAGDEDAKQVQREEREREQVASQKARRTTRRVDKEGIPLNNSREKTTRKRAVVNYYEGEEPDEEDEPLAPVVAAVKAKPPVKPVDNLFRYSFANPVMPAVKPVGKPVVKPVVKQREEINLMDDDEDKPVHKNPKPVVKAAVKPVVKPVVKQREAINLIDDEDQPVVHKKPLPHLSSQFDKYF